MVLCMSDAEKVRENRLRRAAQRQGLMLAKSPRRDPGASGFGTYVLVDAPTTTLIADNREIGNGLNHPESCLDWELS